MLTGICDFPDFNAATSRQKPLEKVIGGLLLFVAAAYIVESIFSQPNLGAAGERNGDPEFTIFGSGLPCSRRVRGDDYARHVIYLHSSLTSIYMAVRVNNVIRHQWTVAIAMTIAGFVNLAMMATAAAAFHFSGHTGVADLDEGYLHAATVVKPCCGNGLWI
ncbi:divalent metal cation transporter [Shigella flexneri]